MLSNLEKFFFRIIAAFAITTLTVIQCYGTKKGIRTTDFLTVSKIIGLIVIIISGLYYLTSGQETNLTNMFDNTSSNIGSYVLAFYSASWAYSGLSATVEIIEELQEPLKANILKSVLISVAIVTTLYLLTNLAYIIVLSPDEILNSNAVAMTFCQRIFREDITSHANPNL